MIFLAFNINNFTTVIHLLGHHMVSFFPIIKRIFALLEVSISTLQEANIFAQKNLLLTQDEWFVHSETGLRKKLQSNKDLLIHNLKQIGMIDEILPTKNNYTYALVMGSFKDDVEQRLNFLAKLYEKGFIFENIVLIGGSRPLTNFEKEKVSEGIVTEMQMIENLCNHYQLFKNQKMIYINAPMIQEDNGMITRPTTESTLKLFAQSASEAGLCLVISNNPYIIRQTKIAQNILDQVDFPTEGAGPAFKENALNIIMLMDEFARRLYEESKSVKKELN